MNYISLIGDIVNSRSIKEEDRFQLQTCLNDVLTRFNNLYPDKIAAKLTLTLGDEFQGLFYDASLIFEIISYLLVKVPYKIRFGIGKGSLFTNINSITAIGTDGPVWWNARNALQKIKEDKTIKTNIIFYGLENILLEELINNTFVFIYKVTKNWNCNQKLVLEKLIYHYGLTDDFKQIEIAKRFEIDPSKVSRVLKTTQYFDYLKIIKNVSNIINKGG
jgi:predicted XRE-type DNA-binding protein